MDPSCWDKSFTWLHEAVDFLYGIRLLYTPHISHRTSTSCQLTQLSTAAAETVMENNYYNIYALPYRLPTVCRD